MSLRFHEPLAQGRPLAARAGWILMSPILAGRCALAGHFDGVATYPSLSVPRNAITSSTSASDSAGWSPWWRL
jgi:hypothetical protein